MERCSGERGPEVNKAAARYCSSRCCCSPCCPGSAPSPPCRRSRLAGDQPLHASGTQHAVAATRQGAQQGACAVRAVQRCDAGCGSRRMARPGSACSSQGRSPRPCTRTRHCRRRPTPACAEEEALTRTLKVPTRTREVPTRTLKVPTRTREVPTRTLKVPTRTRKVPTRTRCVLWNGAWLMPQ